MPHQITYPGTYVEEARDGLHAIVGADTATAAFVDAFSNGPIDTAILVRSFAEFEQRFGGPAGSSDASSGVRQFFLNGGTQAYIVRVNDSGGAANGILGSEASQSGMHALKDPFNILCIPATMKLPSAEAAVIFSAAARLCAGRRAMYILDPPLDAAPDMVAGIAQWLSGNAALRSTDTVLYFPRVVIEDPLAPAQQRVIATSGTMAGVWARSDAARGVWRAPDGEFAVLNGVQGLACGLTDAENDALNLLGINCLRAFYGARPVAWGARTLAGADGTGSQSKYIPIRRLALFLERSLLEGTRWAVFEPNGPALWAQVQQSVGAFMQSLFLQGALSGQTPQQAYFVRCDAAVQTGADEGVVNIEIGFAALEPAEFIVIQIQQMACQNCGP